MVVSSHNSQDSASSVRAYWLLGTPWQAGCWLNPAKGLPFVIIKEIGISSNFVSSSNDYLIITIVLPKLKS